MTLQLTFYWSTQVRLIMLLLLGLQPVEHVGRRGKPWKHSHKPDYHSAFLQLTIGLNHGKSVRITLRNRNGYIHTVLLNHFYIYGTRERFFISRLGAPECAVELVHTDYILCAPTLFKVSHGPVALSFPLFIRQSSV